jgi:hypothetical protein
MIRGRHLLGIGGLVAALAVATSSAFAAPIAATGRPIAPAIGYASQFNTYLIVWAEDRNLGTGLDLYATQVTATGIVVGREVVLVQAPGDQSDPAISYNSRVGDYLIAYTTTGGPQATPSVEIPIPGTPNAPTPDLPPPPGPPFAEPVSHGPDGFTIFSGEAQHLSSEAVDPSESPLPAGARDALRALALQGKSAVGGVIVGPGINPQGARFDTGNLDSYSGPRPLQTQPPLPTPGDPGTALPPPPPGPTTVPPVQPPPSSAPGSRDIYGIWVSRNGFPVTNGFPIIASPADDTFPALAYRALPSFDQWVLVWRDVTGTTVNLRTVELAGYGRYMTFGSGVNSIVSGGDHSRPSVAAGATGEFLVAWSQTQTGKIDRDVVGRRLNSNGFPYGTFLKLADSDADETYPAVGAQTDTGDYLLAWESRVQGQDPDIRVRRLNRNGIPLRAAYEVAGGGPFSFSPALPSSVNRPTVLLTWLDRNSSTDHSILGAEVTRDGRRVGPERLIVVGGSGPSGVTPVAPPPGFPTPPAPPPPPVP